MDLVNRYVQAVRWWLPSKHKRDLTAELAEDLNSQIEEQEAQLDRQLTEAETADLLKRCGHPLVVAGRYLPEQTALDPVFSVLHRFVLKVVLLFVLAPILVLVLTPQVVTAKEPGPALFAALLQAWQATMYAIGMIAVAFAVAKRFSTRTDWQQTWDPRRLPRIRDTRRIPRAGSVVEIVVDLLFLSWWTGLAGGLERLDRAGIDWSPGSLWDQFHHSAYVPVLVLTVAHAALAGFALFRPYWTRARLALRATFNGTMAAVLVFAVLPYWQEFLAQCHELSSAHPALSTSHGVQLLTNVWIFSALLMVACIVAVVCLADVVRALLWREARSEQPADRIVRQS